MAVTKILARRGGLAQAIAYVVNGDKTEEQVPMPSISVHPSSVRVLLPATLWKIYASFASMRICMAPASMLRLTRY